MGYEKDFVDEEPVPFNIDGRKFKYKPTTAGDENNWLNELMIVKPGETAPSIDWSEYNKKKLVNITNVPYTIKNIKTIVGVEKEWTELDVEQKYLLLSKLRPGLFEKIIQALKKIDEPNPEIKN